MLRLSCATRKSKFTHSREVPAGGSSGSCDSLGIRNDDLDLINRGFVWAFAHIRGGGELGAYWYQDGKLMKKRNTFVDFIAAAEHLIKVCDLNSKMTMLSFICKAGSKYQQSNAVKVERGVQRDNCPLAQGTQQPHNTTQRASHQHGSAQALALPIICSPAHPTSLLHNSCVVVAASRASPRPRPASWVPLCEVEVP